MYIHIICLDHDALYWLCAEYTMFAHHLNRMRYAIYYRAPRILYRALLMGEPHNK